MANLRQEWDKPGQESGRDVPVEGRPGDHLDLEGIPTLQPVKNWLELFDPAGPIDPLTSRWLLAVLRFTRADGSPVFGPRSRSSARLRALDAWVSRLGDPSLLAVLERWSPSLLRGGHHSTSFPPLPTDARLDRPLAVLRSDWTSGGDLVAIDHRQVGLETLLEVASRGRTWLGPSWKSGAGVGKITRARPTSWTSGVYADSAEWSFQVGSQRVTRSVTLLRGQSMALVEEQVVGRGDSSEIRLDLGEGIEASPFEGSRAFRLSPGPGRPTAWLIPLGLPAHDRPTDAGSIAVEARQLVIRQQGEGQKRWIAALIGWRKPPTIWRPLTVAERSKTCKSDVARAVRVAWGPRDEGLVVYRSLAAPGLRSFLGHQTGARFLVGVLTRSGDIRALLKIEA